MMISVGPDEKVYPVHKIACIVNSLQDEGIGADQALDDVGLTSRELTDPTTRVSLRQVMQSCRNAIRFSTDLDFPLRAGFRFHVSTYGMYGFAMLSSPDFRQTIQFILKYRPLATPLVELSFQEERGSGVWTIVPLPLRDVDKALYEFLVDMQFAIQTSLFRDIMGPSFGPDQLRVIFAHGPRTPHYREFFSCPIVFRQSENQFLFDAAWLDQIPALGNEITFKQVLKLCDQLMDEFELRVGVAGKVREVLLQNLGRPCTLNSVAQKLRMTARTLRRKLQDEKTTFRAIMDDVRARMAIKYLRDTELTTEQIAFALGFSDATSFRHAFHRWGIGAPSEFKRVVGI